MDILEFSAKLESEFEDLEKGSVRPDTEFRNLPSWSSMHALIIIAFIDLNFDIILNSTELKEAKTISDLYYLATKKSV